MKLSHVRRSTPTPWRGIRHRVEHAEDGYSLIELLIVTAVLPVVIGGIALALITVFSLQSNTSSRIGDSSDAQSVSANFESDVQSAAMITTSSTATQCGSGTQLLGLEWSLNQKTGGYQTVVTYVETSKSLVRQYCASGASSTPTSSTVISHDLQSNQASPTITPSSISTAAASGWTSAVGVTGVTFSITEPGDNSGKNPYAYTLVGLPSASASSSQLSTLAAPTTQCGFATPGTGTYASTLCFVDFTGFSNPTSGCQTVSAGIVNTPYTMTFCVKTTGGSVAPATIPTYFSPPTSEAFLGNNGFYTGIPGKPALYQTSETTTTTVTITNIQVLDSNGNPATGWQFVSGDAESTDSGESITWSSNQDLTLLPDSSTSQIGNACAAPTKANPSAIDLTGLGGTLVECQATVSSDKTGTVILQAPAPASMTITMVGSGLQAIFVGMLLP